MPAFKGRLARQEIWRIIAYMRAGFPGAADPAPPR
jgi:mono/diheme cytochrome c family protein